jgi:HK97 family phage prohead protease
MKKAVDLELQERNASDRTIVGTITTDAVDRYREVVDAKGVVLDHYLKNPVVLLNHNSWNGKAVGRSQWIKHSGNGLVSKTQFAPTDEGKDLFLLYDEGYMKAWSIGFLPLEWKDSDVAEAGCRRKYTSWELLEYSAVTIPANPEAVSNMLRTVESGRVREAIEQSQREINIDQRVSQLFFTIEQQGTSLAELKDAIAEVTALKGLTDTLDKLTRRLDLIENLFVNDSPEPPVNHTHAHTSVPPQQPSVAERNERIARMVAEVVGKRVGDAFTQK